MPARESMLVLGTILLIFLGLVMLLFYGFLGPIVFGILFAALSYPFYRWLTRKFGNREHAAAITTTVLIMLVILVPAITLLTILTREAFGLIDASRAQLVPESPLMIRFTELASRFGVDLQGFIQTELAPALHGLGTIISQQIGGFLSNVLALTLDFFIMAATTFYMLIDGKRFGRFLIHLSPLKNADDLTIYHTFKATGLAVFLATFAGAAAQGILGGLGFFAFGLPSPVLWGTIMTFLALIPFLGPYLIFIPAALYLFISGESVAAIGFLIYNLLIVSTIDNLIKPELVSNRSNIHPLLALLAIVGGLKLFGIIGIIYGPLIVAVFLALLHVYLAHVKAREGSA